MARSWLGLAALAFALAVTMSCGSDGRISLPKRQVANGVSIDASKIQANIQRAVAYLEGVEGASHRAGMLYEAPNGTRTIAGTSWQLNQIYWTQTDNFLAALALMPYNRILSESIWAAITHYEVPSSRKANAFAVLGGETIPDGARAARTIMETAEEDHIVLTEVQDGMDITDWAEYGNLLALQSLNQWLKGNEQESQRMYSALVSMWDGHGINDKAVRADGRYAVYKIALVLLLSKVYEDAPSQAAEMERLMWSAQAESGGIRTDVDARTYAVEAYTNTETTSLALIAYDEALIQSLRSAGLRAQR